MKVEDQAGELRKLMQRAAHRRTIAVTSGKGGVGKSNISLNLGILLSGSGHRVALVDGDIGLANLDVLAGVTVRGNLAHVIAGKRTLSEVIVDLPCGVQFVPGVSGLAKLADLSEFQRVSLLKDLSALEDDNDVIIVDTAGGIGSDVVHFAMAADIVLVVTSPEPAAITDAYALVKLLVRQKYDGQVSILVNQVEGRYEARSTFTRISTVARQFLGAKIFDAGYILMDPRVRDAVRRREPFVLAYPRCPASRCLAALARKLRTGGGWAGEKDGFFRRVANWFA